MTLSARRQGRVDHVLVPLRHLVAAPCGRLRGPDSDRRAGRWPGPGLGGGGAPDRFVLLRVPGVDQPVRPDHPARGRRPRRRRPVGRQAAGRRHREVPARAPCRELCGPGGVLSPAWVAHRPRQLRASRRQRRRHALQSGPLHSDRGTSSGPAEPARGRDHRGRRADTGAPRRRVVRRVRQRDRQSRWKAVPGHGDRHRPAQPRGRAGRDRALPDLHRRDPGPDAHVVQEQLGVRLLRRPGRRDCRRRGRRRARLELEAAVLHRLPGLGPDGAGGRPVHPSRGACLGRVRLHRRAHHRAARARGAGAAAEDSGRGSARHARVGRLSRHDGHRRSHRHRGRGRGRGARCRRRLDRAVAGFSSRACARGVPRPGVRCGLDRRRPGHAGTGRPPPRRRGGRRGPHRTASTPVAARRSGSCWPGRRRLPVGAASEHGSRHPLRPRRGSRQGPRVDAVGPGRGRYGTACRLGHVDVRAEPAEPGRDAKPLRLELGLRGTEFGRLRPRSSAHAQRSHPSHPRRRANRVCGS